MNDVDARTMNFERASGRAVASFAAAVFAFAVATPFGVLAQSPQPQAKPQPTAAAPPAAGDRGDAGLKSRVESLEEQLVDMQVVVGTLESLAKSGSAPAAPSFRPSSPGVGGADAARLDSLEAQIRQLSTQVQALADQLRNSTPSRRSDATGQSFQNSGSDGFGATTVTPGQDAIGGLLSGDAPPPSAAAGSGADASAGVATAALPPASDGVEPKQLYETAYGYLLQRDYGAAEAAFDDFLKRFPTDSLSGNAQYWLGESHFVRGQYKAAAGAFLKGYQTYAQSQKAPDSLLKLAMSLDKLGQKDAACSSFAELGVRFPNAAQSIKARAQSERQRVGCS